MRPTWPLVGRQEELALVKEALRQPEVRGVVLAGDPGVGKTRLAHESVTLARAAGFRGEWAAATHSASRIPFGALAHLLPPDLLAGGEPGQAPSPRNILAEAREALAAGTEPGPLVLGVDDAHLLDDSSAALLYQLAETEDGFVVAAVRSGEPTPDALTGLWRDGLAERVDVQPLSRAEADRLVEAVLGSQVDEATLHRLFEITRGNPLFLRELVLGELQAGSLVEAEGIWRWAGLVSPAPRLLDVLDERLGRLEREEREILEVVAEAEYLGAGVLKQLVTWDTVEALERRGLLESWTDGHRTDLRLAHPLYVEAVLARTPPLRAQTIRSQLADAVESRGANRREDLLRIASWRLAAGDPLRPDLAIEGSRRAALGFDFPLAERLARAALESGGAFEATHALTEALIGQGRSSEADELLRRVEDEPQSEPVRAMSAMARAANLLWRMDHGEAAWEVLERAEATLSDQALRDELAAVRATILVFGGRTPEGIDLGRGVVERAISDRALAYAVPILWGLNVTGQTGEARRIIERVRQPVASLAREFPYGPIWLVINSSVARFLDGDLDDAVSGLESHYRWATEHGSWERAIVPWALGWIEPARGRLRTTRRRLAEAILFLREVDMFNHLPLCLAESAHIDALLGNVGEAETALAEAEQVRLSALRAGEGYFGLARIWVAAARGEISRAIEEALLTAETTGLMGHVVFQATALHDAARLGAARQVADQLEALAARGDGRLIPAYAAHGRALAASDANALHEVSLGFEEMGAMLYAAEAEAEAARIHRSEGRTGSALTASARAARLAAACDGARTPTLAEIDHSLPLSAREREVATLAASGLTNQQVAERLVVSVRTVENHLHAVYGKLEISHRDELGPILGVRSGDAPALSS